MQATTTIGVTKNVVLDLIVGVLVVGVVAFVVVVVLTPKSIPPPPVSVAAPGGPVPVPSPTGSRPLPFSTDSAHSALDAFALKFALQLTSGVATEGVEVKGSNRVYLAETFAQSVCYLETQQDGRVVGLRSTQDARARAAADAGQVRGRGVPADGVSRRR